MTTSKPPSSGSVRRRHERIPFADQAVMVFADGASCTGITRDVSLHGLFLTLSAPPAGVVVGQEGVLQMFSSMTRKEFKCRVAYVAQNGFGVELLDKRAGFSADLTDSLMLESQFRVGVELLAGETIPVEGHKVAARQSAFQQARLIKISSSHLEFCLPAFSGFHPATGDRLELRIVHAQPPPIVMEGVVRSITAGGVCAVACEGVAEPVLRAMKTLMRHLIDKRLQRSISETTRLGATPRVRQVMRQFEGVFGKSSQNSGE
ncbi:MAG: PilZ domain-containing protein [Magnetococcales bacterium]|nr:PilZ domain-containing protein [Magnetococcales bacterium]